MLSFFRGANFYTGNKFGKSKDMPWIDSLKCSGSEKDISSCHLNWTEASCNEFGNVAVSCGKFIQPFSILY